MLFSLALSLKKSNIWLKIGKINRFKLTKYLNYTTLTYCSLQLGE